MPLSDYIGTILHLRHHVKYVLGLISNDYLFLHVRKFEQIVHFFEFTRTSADHFQILTALLNIGLLSSTTSPASFFSIFFTRSRRPLRYLLNLRLRLRSFILYLLLRYELITLLSMFSGTLKVTVKEKGLLTKRLFQMPHLKTELRNARTGRSPA